MQRIYYLSQKREQFYSNRECSDNIKYDASTFEKFFDDYKHKK